WSGSSTTRWTSWDPARRLTRPIASSTRAPAPTGSLRFTARPVTCARWSTTLYVRRRKASSDEAATLDRRDNPDSPRHRWHSRGAARVVGDEPAVHRRGDAGRRRAGDDSAHRRGPRHPRIALPAA